MILSNSSMKKALNWAFAFLANIFVFPANFFVFPANIFVFPANIFVCPVLFICLPSLNDKKKINTVICGTFLIENLNVILKVILFQTKNIFNACLTHFNLDKCIKGFRILKDFFFLILYPFSYHFVIILVVFKSVMGILIHISRGLNSILIFIKHFLSVLKISKSSVYFLKTSSEYLTRQGSIMKTNPCLYFFEYSPDVLNKKTDIWIRIRFTTDPDPHHCIAIKR